MGNTVMLNIFRKFKEVNYMLFELYDEQDGGKRDSNAVIHWNACCIFYGRRFVMHR